MDKNEIISQIDKNKIISPPMEKKKVIIIILIIMIVLIIIIIGVVIYLKFKASKNKDDKNKDDKNKNNNYLDSTKTHNEFSTGLNVSGINFVLK
jgi:flagellar basal body-associated protein FliL